MNPLFTVIFRKRQGNCYELQRSSYFRQGLLTVVLFESYQILSSSFFATEFVWNKKNSFKKRSQTVMSEN
jgi:hypothetical protein